MKSNSGKLVAVVDDDTTILESITDLMTSAGYAVVAFDSAKALLEGVDQLAIGCLVSDIRMPGIDGWELATRIRSAQPQMPLVFMTAHDPAECDASAQMDKLTPARLLRKPFDPQELLSAVSEAMTVKGDMT